ncbi:MAG TPA: hypothetical protein VFU88_04305 [Ktedonobacterales bacterium]|nr:hypothetical protein [Ktedonobacterales bacterium]
MPRQLYRVYLYVVSIALLIFGAIALAMLLDTMLAYTPLRGSFRAAPGQNELVQRVIFAVVAWLIVAVLGGLHYRLIRQDIVSHPPAAGGGVRSFFLNIPEAVAVLIGVFAVSGGFSTLAARDPFGTPDAATPFAVGIAALLVAVLLESERRRSVPAAGAPMVFQRLHVFGVPFVVLFAAAVTAWGTAMRATVAALLMQANVYNPLDPDACAISPFGPGKEIVGPCALPNVGFLWLAVLVMVAAVAVYVLLARDDARSIIRTVAHLASLALGLVLVVIGLNQGVELLLRGTFGVPVGWGDVAHPWNASYDFISPLTLGALVTTVYALWLRAERALSPLGTDGTLRTMEALAAVVFAVPFWWGLGRLLYAGFDWLGLGGALAPFPADWAAALATLIAGLAYVPLSVLLLRRGAEAGAPRRGYILALLAGGVVTGAAGLAVTLYTLATAALGVPLDNWQQAARAGTAALLVGLAITGIYGWIALREHTIEPLFARRAAAPFAVTPQAEAGGQALLPGTIEQVLDAFAAHKLTRDEAAERIRELTHAEPIQTETEPTHADPAPAGV